MPKTKKNLTRYIVHYDTKWIHPTLELQHYFYAKAKTPIQEIIPELEKRINRFGNLNENYQTQNRFIGFNRLYRNLIKSYQGWQVRYREPKSHQDYDILNQKINCIVNTGNLNQKPPGGNSVRLWTHDLYPFIDRVSIDTAFSAGRIAKILNERLKNGNLSLLLQKWKPDLDIFYGNYHELVKRNLSFDVSKDQRWQTFLENLEQINHFSKTLNFSNSKDYKVNATNVHNVLQSKYKTAKGWRVKILDQNQ